MILRFFIWFLFLVGGAIVSFLFDFRFARSVVTNPLFHLVSACWGIILLVFVLRASRNTGRWLARYGRQGEVPRMETNRLVTTGYYACMRHPMHFGLLFFPLAFALLLGSPTFILVIAPIEALVIILLVRWIEEPQARRKFGPVYDEYRKQVPFFSLRWSCLKQLFGPAPFPKNQKGTAPETSNQQYPPRSHFEHHFSSLHRVPILQIQICGQPIRAFHYRRHILRYSEILVELQTAISFFKFNNSVISSLSNERQVISLRYPEAIGACSLAVRKFSQFFGVTIK